MSKINWRNAPEWANAVIKSKDDQEFYVSQFGGISARQRVGYSQVDTDASADMILPHDWTLVETRHPAWIGEGPPPVGTVCEFRKYSPLDSGEWIAGDIRYLSDCTIVIGGDKCEHIHHPRTLEFRPIRTPEQIAAEKVSKQLDSDLAMYGTSFALTNDDGSITRLDPTKIVMRMQEAK